ncbi:MAG: adenylosuccinate synthetase, partial [Dehalococcoidia bacterium]|nr:adenylosuccinate synthetase [Dehalococcoidia bacterium]
MDSSTITSWPALTEAPALTSTSNTEPDMGAGISTTATTALYRAERGGGETPSRGRREAVHFLDGRASHKRGSARSESTMPVVVVVGGQWGDEGKGRIVDL